MPLRFGKLIGWCLLVYFVVDILRGLLRTGGFDRLGELLYSPHLLILLATSLLSFSAYSIGAYLLLYCRYERTPVALLAAAFIPLIAAVMLLRAFIQEVLLYELFGIDNYDDGITWTAYALDNLYYAILFVPVGVVYYFFQYGNYAQTQRHETEVAFREAELRFLRSQINPHFLFNTLNNLYALVSTNNPKSLPALEKLSSLLRYSLYHQDQLVPLVRELDYVRDLVHLESLRIARLAAPLIEITDEADDWKVPPLILVPFVENAFKHGRLTDSQRPLRITLRTDRRQLIFGVTNAVKPATDTCDGVGGIGLRNTRKRLELLYPGRHRLTTRRENDTFIVLLTIYRSAP